MHEGILVSNSTACSKILPKILSNTFDSCLQREMQPRKSRDSRVGCAIFWFTPSGVEHFSTLTHEFSGGKIWLHTHSM